MSKLQRVENVLLGIDTILLSLLMFWFPNEGFYIVVQILCFSLLARGIGQLFYYFTMARHMVGGKTILFTGVIILDLGLFTFTLSDIPRVYIMLYLLGAHAFAGVIDVMRALEARRFEAPSWKINMGYGVINIALAVGCILFIRRVDMTVYIYSAGLAYSGLNRIISAFRRTAVVYIQ